jgi:N-acetylglucosaminyldiphosphoundecaprenol N-acetyl-beta-D-mannosaminyltransferase
MAAAVEAVIRWAAEDGHSCRYVCVSGMHGVVEAQSDDSFRAILNSADLNIPDGMPLTWLGWFAGFEKMGRVFGPDFMLRVCEASVESGSRHFFYGGNEGVADELAERLRKEYPGIKVAGTYCPPFRSLSDEEKAGIIGKINGSAAQIVWVGLSTPKQERWMSGLAPHLAAQVVLGVGAAFDFNTQKIRRAPIWMQRSGLEWLSRLIQEPRRLAKRYCTGIPKFGWAVLKQAFRE